MNVKNIEKKIWQEINDKNTLKNKLSSLIDAYGVIKNENQIHAKIHKDHRILKLVSNGLPKRELEAMKSKIDFI